MNNKMLLAALSQDLYRIAESSHRGSKKVVEVFTKEALKTKDEVNIEEVEPYIKVLLDKLESTLSQSDEKQKAEDALMYSTLLQNYAQTL